MPLVEQPAKYLTRLKGRFEAIAAGKIGEFHPVVKDDSPKR